MLDLTSRQTALTDRMKRKAKRRSSLRSRLQLRTTAKPEKAAPKAQVSQFTRDRLYNEALRHPAYEGMAPEDVRSYINQKIDEYITDYPVWFGHLKADQPKRDLTEKQRQHMQRMLERKKEIHAEVEKPYVKNEDEVPE